MTATILGCLLPYIGSDVLVSGMVGEIVECLARIPDKLLPSLFYRDSEAAERSWRPVVHPYLVPPARGAASGPSTPTAGAATDPSGCVADRGALEKESAVVPSDRCLSRLLLLPDEREHTMNRARVREMHLLRLLLGLKQHEMERVTAWLFLKQALEEGSFFEDAVEDVKRLAAAALSATSPSAAFAQCPGSDSPSVTPTSMPYRAVLAPSMLMLQLMTETLLLLPQHCSGLVPSTSQLSDLAEVAVALSVSCAPSDTSTLPLRRCATVLSCFLALYPLRVPPCILQRELVEAEAALPFWLPAVSAMPAIEAELRAGEAEVSQTTADEVGSGAARQNVLDAATRTDLGEALRRAFVISTRTTVYALPLGQLFRADGSFSSIPSFVRKLIASVVEGVIRAPSDELWAYFTPSAIYSVADAVGLYSYFFTEFPRGLPGLLKYTVAVSLQAQQSATSDGGEPAWPMQRCLSLYNFVVVATAYHTPLEALPARICTRATGREVPSHPAHGDRSCEDEGRADLSWLRESVSLIAVAANAVMSSAPTPPPLETRGWDDAAPGAEDAAFLRSGLFLLHSLLSNYQHELADLSTLINEDVKSMVRSVVFFLLSRHNSGLPALEILCGIVRCSQSLLGDMDQLGTMILSENVVNRAAVDSSGPEMCILLLQLFNALNSEDMGRGQLTSTAFLEFVARIRVTPQGAALVFRLYEEWVPTLHAMVSAEALGATPQVVHRGLHSQWSSLAGEEVMMRTLPETAMLARGVPRTGALIQRTAEALALALLAYAMGSIYFCDRGVADVLEMTVDVLYAASRAGNHDAIAQCAVAPTGASHYSLTVLLLSVVFGAVENERLIEKGAAIVVDAAENSTCKLFTTVRQCMTTETKKAFSTMMYGNLTSPPVNSGVAIVRLKTLQALLNYDSSLFFYLTSRDDGCSTMPSVSLEKLLLVEVLVESVKTPSIHPEERAESLELLRMLGYEGFSPQRLSELLSSPPPGRDPSAPESVMGDALLAASATRTLAQRLASLRMAEARTTASRLQAPMRVGGRVDGTQGKLASEAGPSGARAITPLQGSLGEPRRSPSRPTPGSATVVASLVTPSCVARMVSSRVLAVHAPEINDTIEKSCAIAEQLFQVICWLLENFREPLPREVSCGLVALGDGCASSVPLPPTCSSSLAPVHGSSPWSSASPAAMCSFVDQIGSSVCYAQVGDPLQPSDAVLPQTYPEGEHRWKGRVSHSTIDAGGDPRVSGGECAKRVRFSHGGTFALSSSSASSRDANMAISLLDALTQLMKALELVAWTSVADSPQLSKQALNALATALRTTALPQGSVVTVRPALRACVLASLDLAVAVASAVTTSQRQALGVEPPSSSLRGLCPSSSPPRSGGMGPVDEVLSPLVSLVQASREDDAIVYRAMVLAGRLSATVGHESQLSSQLMDFAADALDARKGDPFSYTKDAMVTFAAPLCRHLVATATLSATARLTEALWTSAMVALRDLPTHGPVTPLSHHFTKTLSSLNALLLARPDSAVFLNVERFVAVIATLGSLGSAQAGKGWCRSYVTTAPRQGQLGTAPMATTRASHAQASWHHAWVAVLRCLQVVLVAVTKEACVRVSTSQEWLRRSSETLIVAAPRFAYALSLFTPSELLPVPPQALEGPLFYWDLVECQLSMSIVGLLSRCGYSCAPLLPHVKLGFCALRRYRVRSLRGFSHPCSNIGEYDDGAVETIMVSSTRDALLYFLHQSSSPLAAATGHGSAGWLPVVTVSRPSSPDTDLHGDTAICFELLRGFIAQTLSTIRKAQRDNGSATTSPFVSPSDGNAARAPAVGVLTPSPLESVADSAASEVSFASMVIHKDNLFLSLRLFMAYARLYVTQSRLATAERRELGDHVEKLSQALARLLADLRRMEDVSLVHLVEGVCKELRALVMSSR